MYCKCKCRRQTCNWCEKNVNPPSNVLRRNTIVPILIHDSLLHARNRSYCASMPMIWKVIKRLCAYTCRIWKEWGLYLSHPFHMLWGFDIEYAVRNMYLQNCWILLLNRCCYTKSFNPPMRARETSAYALCVCVYVCGACTCKIQKKCRLQPNIPFPQAMTKLRALHEWSRGGASTPVCKGSPRQRGCIDTPGHTIVGLTSPWARRNILLV